MPGRAPAQAEEAAAVERPMRDMRAGAADRLSLHRPGAQGRGPFGPVDPYRLETTELAATDDLYAPCLLYTSSALPFALTTTCSMIS